MTAQLFVVERYLVARLIWKKRNERAHDGFPATATRAAVPAQSWSEWFSWCFGMTLEEYSELAKAGKHAELVKQLGSVVVDYRIAGEWHTAIAPAGETYEECAASLQRMFPQIDDVRPHNV